MALYVNNEKIEQQQIDNEIQRLRPQYEQVFIPESEQQKAEYDKQLEEWSTENVVERTLFRHAARAEIKDIPHADIDKEYNELLEQNGGKDRYFENMGFGPEQEDKIKSDIADQMRIAKLNDRLTESASAPSKEDMRKYYDEHPDDFTKPEMVRAAHIIKHLSPEVDSDQAKEQMHQILWEVRNKNNFDELAMKNSDCPENAGDLGFFGRGQMVQEFEDAVFNMNVGEISEVFQTQFGFHIAKLTDKKPSSLCPFEEVAEPIEKELFERAKQALIEEFIDAEKAKAVIEEK
jgi:parvulin-like peptidyl-prolyl isomerase